MKVSTIGPINKINLNQRLKDKGYLDRYINRISIKLKDLHLILEDPSFTILFSTLNLVVNLRTKGRLSDVGFKRLKVISKKEVCVEQCRHREPWNSARDPIVYVLRSSSSFRQNRHFCWSLLSVTDLYKGGFKKQFEIMVSIANRIA